MHICVCVCVSVSCACVFFVCVCVSVMKIDKMKEKQVVSSWSFLVSLSHHGNRLLPPSCTPVYLVYSSPIHPPLASHAPLTPPPSLSCILSPLYLLQSPPPLIIQISCCVSFYHPATTLSERAAISQMRSQLMST